MLFELFTIVNLALSFRKGVSKYLYETHAKKTVKPITEEYTRKYFNGI